jgi:hypothetical protein
MKLYVILAILLTVASFFDGEWPGVLGEWCGIVAIAFFFAAIEIWRINPSAWEDRRQDALQRRAERRLLRNWINGKM